MVRISLLFRQPSLLLAFPKELQAPKPLNLRKKKKKVTLSGSHSSDKKQFRIYDLLNISPVLFLKVLSCHRN